MASALSSTSVNQEPTSKCKFGRIIDLLDPEDFATMKDWIERRGFGAPKIKKGLAESQIDLSVGGIGQDTIGRHLSGSCGCQGNPPFRKVDGGSNGQARDH